MDDSKSGPAPQRVDPFLHDNSPIPCPECGSRSVYRLHRNSLEKLATALSGVYPYICKSCYTKFYKTMKVD